MNIQVLPKEALDKWVELLGNEFRIMGPKRRLGAEVGFAGGNKQFPGEHFLFDELQGGHELELSYPTTVLPPKKFFLPQKETLFKFKENGRTIDPQLDERPTVIFGIHTCDLHAILLIDQIFSQNGADQHYLARRSNAILVSIECLEPCTENAFCKDMGTWTVPEGFDIHLTDLGSEYAVEIGSEKGAALLQGIDSLRKATTQDQQRFQQVRSTKWSCFPYRLELDQSELPGLLTFSYRSQVWEQLGQKCLGCGVCTVVCPTCFCFDVLDEVSFDLSSGQRYRIWDSCQFSQFASVAGGHDFRNSRAARLRHRFGHKYKYQTERTGLAGCVGCGRCSEACLVHINPIDTLNDLHQKRRAVADRRREVGA
jgi:sulfhydrogenase subunit beta (sulfur reductase)